MKNKRTGPIICGIYWPYDCADRLFTRQCNMLNLHTDTATSRKVVGKKNIKVYATRPKGGLGIHWNFAYWPKGNLQVCFGKFVFPLWGPYL